MCNESAAKVGCSYSDPKPVQSYGPLRSEHLNQPTASVDGLNVTWTISGTSNGEAAIVALSVDGGVEDIVAQGSPGPFSFTKTVTTSGYNTPTSIRVRLFDDNPVGRGEAFAHGQADSGNPPPPTLRIFPGANCSDDAVAHPDASRCGFTPPCNDLSVCRKLNLEAVGFVDRFSCKVTYHTEGWHVGSTDGTFVDGSHSTKFYFAAGGVTLRCWSGSESNPKQVVESSGSW
jgi:hypothetical protein